MEIFKKEDKVTIELGGKKASGSVLLASPNGISLMVAFNDLIGGYVGMMPLLYDEDAECFKDLIEQREVTIKRKI